MIIGFYEEMTEHCPLDHKIQTLCNCPQSRTMLDRSDWEIIKALPNFIDNIQITVTWLYSYIVTALINFEQQ